MLKLLRPREIACRQAVELVTDYLEGAMPARLAVRLVRHLDACPHCTEYFAQIRSTIAAAGSIDANDLDDEVVTDLVHLYRRWLTDDA